MVSTAGSLLVYGKWVALLLLLRATLSRAQVGVSLCACNPATYTFELNFTAVCEDSSVTGPGIEGIFCFSREFGLQGNVTDFEPVAVSEVTILELNQDLQPFVQVPVEGDFRTGNTFKYSSISGTAALNETTIPGGLQMNIVGRNRVDQDISNVWIIVFTNECGIFPIFEIGDNIGWIKVVRA